MMMMMMLSSFNTCLRNQIFSKDSVVSLAEALTLSSISSYYHSQPPEGSGRPVPVLGNNLKLVYPESPLAPSRSSCNVPPTDAHPSPAVCRLFPSLSDTTAVVLPLNLASPARKDFLSTF